MTASIPPGHIGGDVRCGRPGTEGQKILPKEDQGQQRIRPGRQATISSLAASASRASLPAASAPRTAMAARAAMVQQQDA